MRKNMAAVLVSLLLLVGCSSENPSENPREKKAKKKTSLSFPVISSGEKVTLSDHTVEGEYTVFKFTADW